MEAFNWGASMYGGYYVNYWVDNTHIKNVHFDLLRELQAWCKLNGITIPKWKRYDTI